MIVPNFQNRACCEKYLKDNKPKSPHLARTYVWKFVLSRYPLLGAHYGTDNVLGQLCDHLSCEIEVLSIYASQEHQARIVDEGDFFVFN